MNYIIALYMLLCCVFSLKATQKSLGALQNSLEQLAKVIAKNPKITAYPKQVGAKPCETLGYFDENFKNVDAAFEAIKCHKDKNKNFRFEVTKEIGRNPQWSITYVTKYDATHTKFNDDFRDIIEGRAPARMVFADNYYIGIFSRLTESDPNKHASKTNSRIMIIPQANVLDITDINKDELQKLLEQGLRLAKQLNSGDHYELFTNRGYRLQYVPHLHLHVNVHHNPPLGESIFSKIKDEKWDKDPFYRLDLLDRKKK